MQKTRRKAVAKPAHTSVITKAEVQSIGAERKSQHDGKNREQEEDEEEGTKDPPYILAESAARAFIFFFFKKK